MWLCQMIQVERDLQDKGCVVMSDDTGRKRSSGQKVCGYVT